MTPSERLRRLLAERELGQTAFARIVEETTGTKCGFHNVHRWLNGKEFTARNQERAARALGLAADYFRAPNEAMQREREAREALEQFLATDYGRSLTPPQVEVLKTVRFLDPRMRTTPAFYEALAAAVRGHIRMDEVLTVASDNAALDESLAHKPPLKRR